MEVRINYSHVIGFIEATSCYRFNGNVNEIFEKFFGNANPFVESPEFDARDQVGSMFGDAFGGKAVA